MSQTLQAGFLLTQVARIWRDEAIATLRLANSDAIETAEAAHVE